MGGVLVQLGSPCICPDLPVPMGGFLVPVLGLGGSWCIWGSPRTHADLPVPMGGVLVPVLRLGESWGPHALILTFLSPWGGVLVPVLGLGGGSWCSWGPHAPMLTFLSPWGGRGACVGAEEGVLVQLGVPTHPC